MKRDFLRKRKAQMGKSAGRSGNAPGSKTHDSNKLKCLFLCWNRPKLTIPRAESLGRAGLRSKGAVIIFGRGGD